MLSKFRLAVFVRGAFGNLMNNDEILNLKQMAKAKDSFALFKLGIYEFNSDNFKDAKECFSQFFQIVGITNSQIDELVITHFQLTTQLVDLASEEEFFYIAHFYHEQENDLDSAKFWYQLAIALGNAAAAFNLAIIYQNDEKLNLAKKFFSTSQHLGERDAYFNHAEIEYREGNREVAIEILKSGADLGCPRSLNKLGQISKSDGDLKSAVEWFKKAANDDYADSIVELGAILFDKGKYEEAEKMFLRAVDLKSVWAMTFLGWTFAQLGDRIKSRGWYLTAAENGDTDGMMELGLLSLEDGNKEAALKWIKQAELLGNERAREKLQDF